MTEVEVHMATADRWQVAHRQYKFDHDGWWRPGNEARLRSLQARAMHKRHL